MIFWLDTRYFALELMRALEPELFLILHLIGFETEGNVNGAHRTMGEGERKRAGTGKRNITHNFLATSPRQARSRRRKIRRDLLQTLGYLLSPETPRGKKRRGLLIEFNTRTVREPFKGNRRSRNPSKAPAFALCPF